MPQGGQGQLTTSPGQNVATPLTGIENEVTVVPGFRALCTSTA